MATNASRALITSAAVFISVCCSHRRLHTRSRHTRCLVIELSGCRHSRHHNARRQKHARRR
uniref:Secreted protein n=1 Tax=Mesocestoides corti TaxID=53468 RepID=A0A5K3G599_MESCO